LYTLIMVLTSSFFWAKRVLISPIQINIYAILFYLVLKSPWVRVLGSHLCLRAHYLSFLQDKEQSFPFLCHPQHFFTLRADSISEFAQTRLYHCLSVHSTSSNQSPVPVRLLVSS
jgi:hypothetical protein